MLISRRRRKGVTVRAFSGWFERRLIKCFTALGLRYIIADTRRKRMSEEKIVDEEKKIEDEEQFEKVAGGRPSRGLYPTREDNTEGGAGGSWK